MLIINVIIMIVLCPLIISAKMLKLSSCYTYKDMKKCTTNINLYTLIESLETEHSCYISSHTKLIPSSLSHALALSRGNLPLSVPRGTVILLSKFGVTCNILFFSLSMSRNIS